MDNAAYTPCVSTGPRDIEAALIAQMPQLAPGHAPWSAPGGSGPARS
ncbi:hypothetical protein GCM10010294_54820 [Streptomyces griseoloalbus]|nr:hypothetical protein GCM10010294_54820 [Streptomyces griseoloalbus]